MTGNVVILGMALAGADDLPVLGPTLALVGFLAGAAIGGRVLRSAPAGWSHRTSGTFAATGVLAVGLGVGALVAPPVGGDRLGVSSSPRCWPSRWGCRPRRLVGSRSRT